MINKGVQRFVPLLDVPSSLVTCRKKGENTYKYKWNESLRINRKYVTERVHARYSWQFNTSSSPVTDTRKGKKRTSTLKQRVPVNANSMNF